MKWISKNLILAIFKIENLVYNCSIRRAKHCAAPDGGRPDHKPERPSNKKETLCITRSSLLGISAESVGKRKFRALERLKELARAEGLDPFKS